MLEKLMLVKPNKFINKYMKKTFKFIQKYLSELMIIIGSGIFTYNVFNFSYKGMVGKSIADFFGPDVKVIEGVAYYYKDSTLLLITIGAILVITGIIIRKNYKFIK